MICYLCGDPATQDSLTCDACGQLAPKAQALKIQAMQPTDDPIPDRTAFRWAKAGITSRPPKGRRRAVERADYEGELYDEVRGLPLTEERREELGEKLGVHPRRIAVYLRELREEAANR